MLADGLNALIQLLRYFRVSGALEHEVVRLVHQNEPGQLAEIPIGLKVGAVPGGRVGGFDAAALIGADDAAQQRGALLNSGLSTLNRIKSILSVYRQQRQLPIKTSG